MLRIINFATKEKQEIVDLTAQIEELVLQAKVSDGFCLISVPHATAAVYVNENEEGLKKDMLEILKNLVPQQPYFHNKIDNNAQAHLLSSLIGTSVSLPIIRAELGLGTWQRILFLELDGPRHNRRVFIQIQTA